MIDDDNTRMKIQITIGFDYNYDSFVVFPILTSLAVVEAVRIHLIILPQSYHLSNNNSRRAPREPLKNEVLQKYLLSAL